jgi:hypothetical protein
MGYQPRKLGDVAMNRLTLVAPIALTISGCDAVVEAQMDEIENQVAEDAVEQYQIAKRQGDTMQTCVQAGLVSAAYLQATNESEYNRWKAIEKANCASAGLPR